MKIIKNSNGNKYQVIEEYRKYLLLENQTTNDNKYVVAFNYDGNIQTWQQGSYFDDLEEAKKYFNKITIK